MVKRSPQAATGGSGEAQEAVANTSPSASQPTLDASSIGGERTLDYTIFAPEEMAVIVPNEDFRYLIDDNQLDLICKGGEKHNFDWSLALLFGGAGLAQNIIQVFIDLHSSVVPSILNILLALLSISLLSTGLLKYLDHKRDGNLIDRTREKIKTGKKVTVKIG